MTAFADYILQKKTHGAPDNDGGLLTLSSPTEVIGDNEDTANASVSFGFDFNYDGTDYSSCTVYSDGWLKFAGTWPTNVYQNNVFDDLSNTSVSLHPWHDDLETQHTTGYVRHETLGSAPNRYCVIEWRCYAKYNHTASHNCLLTFQVVLRETSNNIEFRYAPSGGSDYGETGSPSYSSVSATIGARVSTASAVAGNIREFTEEAGTPDANGGVSTTPIKLDCSPEPGNEWPGDSTNVIEGASFNFHFIATQESEEVAEEEEVAAVVTDATEAWIYGRARLMLDALLPGNRRDEEQVRILTGGFVASAKLQAVSRNEIMGLQDLLDPSAVPARFLPFLGRHVGLTPDTGITGHLTENKWRSLIPQMGEALRKKGTSFREILFGIVGRPMWVGYWHDLRHELADDDPTPLLGYDAADDSGNPDRTVTIHIPDPFGTISGYTLADGEVAVNRDLVHRAVDLVRQSGQRVDLFYYDWVDDFSQGIGRWERVSGTGDLVHDDTNWLMTVPASTGARVVMGGVAAHVEYGVWEAWIRMDTTAAAYELRFRWEDGGAYYSLTLTPNSSLPWSSTVALAHSTAGSIDSGTALLPLNAWVFVQITCTEVASSDDEFTVQIDGDDILSGTLATQTNKGAMGVVTPAGATLDIRLVEQYQAPATQVRVGPAT